MQNRYSALKKVLVVLRVRHPTLSDHQKARIQSAVQMLADLERLAEQVIEDGRLTTPISKINVAMSAYIDDLNQMLVELRESFDG